MLWAPTARGQAHFDVMDRRGEILGWAAVGRVDTGNGFCTGTLIARSLVLTAAHCVFDARGRRLTPGRMLFRAGYHRGTALADRTVTRIAVSSGYRHTGDRKPNGTMIANDVALLALDRPIFATEADPFMVQQAPAKGTQVSVVSYGAGREEVLSRERRCALTGRYQGGILAFDCDVTFGSSGAPVFLRQDGRLRILSVISASGSDADGTRTAFGMTLPDQVAALRAELAREEARPLVSEGARRIGAGERAGTTARFIRP